MIAIDTNVLVRYLVQDDRKQSAAATRLLEEQCTAAEPGFINHIVLCELVWVLDGNYRVKRGEIAGILEALLQTAQLTVMEPSSVWNALRDYRDSNVHFADHLVARVNESRGFATTVTFDRKAAALPLFELLK